MTAIATERETVAPTDAATIVDRTVDEWSTRLTNISRTLHADPEIAFEEHRAAALLADTLRGAGFAVEAGVYGLPTAFEAVFGDGEFVVTLCAEYDALPGIGHACGHNLIAAAAVGAAVALAAVAGELDITVKVLGTPAEEHGGGKVLLLEAGAWEDATVSMMVHGGPFADIRCDQITSQAVERFDVVYHGRASHATAAPQLGVNALDASTIALSAIGLLRQHLPGSVRVAAIVGEGGEATNIVPARAVVRAEVRAFDSETLADAVQRVAACFEAGALATGCTWTKEQSEPRYESLVHHPALSAAWNDAMRALGRDPITVDASQMGGGSTDMGNVSQVLPAIQPVIAILGSTALPHTLEFAADAATPAAERALLDGAKGLARTAAHVAADAGARAELLAAQHARPAGATMRAAVE